MLGVILCGGQSIRMGSDKGLLHNNGNTWAHIAQDKMSFLSLSSVISINASQLTRYSSLFQKSELIVDNADLGIGGPLLGLLTVHSLFPEEDLLLLACDLAEMKSIVIQELISNQNRVKGAEAIVFNNNGRIEPLCGIYKAIGLNKLLTAYHAHNLKRHSMHYALEILSTHYIPLKHEWVSAFHNFNSSSDLL